MAVGAKAFLLPWSLFLVSFFADRTFSQTDLSVDVGGKRFTIVTRDRNWYRANIDCRAGGMSLAAIETVSEHTALRNLIIDNELFDNEFWVSGSNLAGGNGYVWLSTGNKLRYTNWQSGKPSGVASTCVYIDKQYKWNDVECNNFDTKYYICVRPLVPNCGITGHCKRVSNFN